MAMQPDIQYVSFYVDGTAARKLDRAATRKVKAPKPKQRKVKRRVIKVDPVALIGLVAAVVMLISMGTGIARYRSCMDAQQQMGQYIEALQQENAQLQKTYDEGYDLEQVRSIASAIGMVPVEQAEHIVIDVQVPQQEQRQLSFWEEATIFLAGLFA